MLGGLRLRHPPGTAKRKKLGSNVVRQPIERRVHDLAVNAGTVRSDQDRLYDLPLDECTRRLDRARIFDFGKRDPAWSRGSTRPDRINEGHRATIFERRASATRGCTRSPTSPP